MAAAPEGFAVAGSKVKGVASRMVPFAPTRRPCGAEVPQIARKLLPSLATFALFVPVVSSSGVASSTCPVLSTRTPTESVELLP